MIDFITSLILIGFIVAAIIGIAIVAGRVILAILEWFADSLAPVLVGAFLIGLATITVVGVASAVFG